MTTELRRHWERHGHTVLLLAVACMAAAALWRLGHELPRLLWESGGTAGFDLRLRHREVQLWFTGEPIYNEIERGDYPPASYVMLWPLLGWLDVAAARVLWAVTGLLALGWLAVLFVRESTAATRLQVAMVALLPFSTYGTAAATGLGQVGNHLLPLLLAGLLALRPDRDSWRQDLAAAALLLPVLVKPTLTAAFFWLVCFVPRRIRPIAMVVAGYVALTWFAISFQDGPIAQRLLGWLSEPPQALDGTANLHRWLALAGLAAWALPASIVLLLALAVWVYRYRDADLWLLIGVSALVGRLYIHHRVYDDVLLLLPMITLFRIARQGARPDGIARQRARPDDRDVHAGVLFAALWLTLHAPARWLAHPVLRMPMEVLQSVVWLAVLAFLLWLAQRDRTGAPLPAQPVRRAA